MGILGRPSQPPANFGLNRAWEQGAAMRMLTRNGLMRHLALQAWRSFIASPLTSLLTVFTISVSLLVFTLFLLTLENLRGVVSSTRSDFSLVLYLREGYDSKALDQLRAELEDLPEVKEVKFRDKTQALEAFRKELGEQAAILEGLENSNPLPASLEVRFRSHAALERSFDEYAERFAKKPIVEQIDYSRALIHRLSGLLSLFRWAGTLLVLLMLVMTSFIITNTIRLALYAHREEIEIMKLVGATDWFVRAPYIIEGFVQGLIGSVGSIVLAYLFLVIFRESLADNEILGAFIPQLEFLSFFSLLIVIVSGVLVGAAGSFLAVRRFLEV